MSWQNVLNDLDTMRGMIASGHFDLNQFAASYASLSKSYLSAIAVEGKTSIRAQAVAKALDLRTPKSQLESFVGR